MDRIQLRRIALRRQVCFRCMILVASIILIMSYVLANSYSQYQGLSNIALGIGGSLLAWVLVAFWDLMIDTSTQYLAERDAFSIEVRNVMERIIKVIKEYANQDKSVDEIQSFLKQEATSKQLVEMWTCIDNEINTLHDFMVKVSLESKIYVLSKEYRDFECYTWRCFWILSACMYNRKCDSKKLYEKFFKLEEHTEVIDSLNVMRAFANEIHATKDAYNELKEIDLNDAPLEEISPWVLGEYLGSVITNECINDIANGVAKYKALYFIPYIRFEKILAAEETVALSWLSMLKLLYPLMFSKK